MKNCFCTLFDSRYLDRGLTLYESIDRHCDSFELWVLCMDDSTYDFLAPLRLQNMRLIKLEELEKHDSQLKEVKSERSQVEYYFTCKPSLTLYILDKCDYASQVTYIDPDIFFFASPETIYEQLEGKSVAITPHRFEHSKKYLEEYGKFNAGWVLFKRDVHGLACLRWWRERCLEWCSDYPESDRFADQKYIDRFSSLFEGVWSVDNIGVNLAPWNIAGKSISCRKNKLYVDGEQVIFYHFHNLRPITKRVFNLGCKDYTAVLDNKVRRYIYRPYISSLLRKKDDLFFMPPPLARGGQKMSCEKANCQENLLGRCLKKVRFMIMLGKGLKRGEYMIGRQGVASDCGASKAMHR